MMKEITIRSALPQDPAEIFWSANFTQMAVEIHISSALEGILFASAMKNWSLYGII